MNINQVLPSEILTRILLLATQANQVEGASFTYGLTQAPQPYVKAKLTKYVRGPLSAESLRWDATQSIRQVCQLWHHWALQYNLENVFERKWKGSERWSELSTSRKKYDFYELVQNPSGFPVYRDPSGSLKQTDRLFRQVPSMADHVRRLWFNGFYAPETDRLILSLVASCHELSYVSAPWTILRRATAAEWIDLLNVNTGHGRPLHSLELQAVGLAKDQAKLLGLDQTPCPLQDPAVDFSALKRLKIFGNTTHKPIDDNDLHAIARTATNLECLDLTNISTVSVAGMLALVRASYQTLQVLEHSPRSDDGFYHPYPGHLETGEHICKLLAGLPKMRDLSISIPHVCSDLFLDEEVVWSGECQVRATDFCGCDENSATRIRAGKLQSTLAAARKLIKSRRRLGHHLSVELFFAGCIFEPGKQVVHGDFSLAEICSNGQWPHERKSSTKGPYGTSGVYEKEEGLWDAISEEEFIYAVGRRWIPL